MVSRTAQELNGTRRLARPSEHNAFHFDDEVWYAEECIQQKTGWSQATLDAAYRMGYIRLRYVEIEGRKLIRGGWLNGWLERLEDAPKKSEEKDA